LNIGYTWPAQTASRCETSSAHPEPHTDQLLPSHAAAAIKDIDDAADFSNACDDMIDAEAEKI
jgi:hypothetical protein